MPRGGYQKPTNPAPVSGPGKFSRRTDGGPGSKQAQRELRGNKYGETKALQDAQSAAPMAGGAAPSPALPKTIAQPAVTPLMAPTQRPGEPVTQGLPFGAGDNNIPTRPSGDTTSIVGKYLPTLEALAAQDDVPDAFRMFVRAVKSNVNFGSVQ